LNTRKENLILKHPSIIFLPLGLACLILVICGFSGVPPLRVTGYEIYAYIVLFLGIILMAIPLILFFFCNDEW
jgi:hypothetical protein